MELKVWAKTILTVQKYLDRVTSAIDSLIYKKAMASVYVTSKNLTEQSAKNVSEIIIDLSERKIHLINLNTICVGALKGIDRINAKLLILKHVDGRTSGEIANLLGISERTYFRRLSASYEQIADWLDKNKFSANYFEKKYKNEGWILEIYNRNKEMMGGQREYHFEFESNFLSRVIKNVPSKPVIADSKMGACQSI